MKILLVIIFYGLFYNVFEDIFNYISIDLFDKKKTWKEKLRLKPSCPSSLWMIPNGSICGLLLYLIFLIPFNMLNIIHILIVCALGMIIITGVELGSGILLNIKLKLSLWDYSKSKIKIFGKVIPLHYKGQIDIYHSLGWFGLTYLFYIINQLFRG